MDILLLHKILINANANAESTQKTLKRNCMGDCMIFIWVKPRVIAKVGQAMKLGDVADFMADARFQLGELPIILPLGQGVWQMDALQLTLQIQDIYPDEVVHVLGDGIGWLHREINQAIIKQDIKKPSYVLHAFAACFVLAVGCMFSLPYSIGVLIAGSVYYVFIGRKVASPFPVRLGTYHEAIEKKVASKQ